MESDLSFSREKPYLIAVIKFHILNWNIKPLMKEGLELLYCLIQRNDFLANLLIFVIDLKFKLITHTEYPQFTHFNHTNNLLC